MKTMKYILIVIGLVSILTIKAETWSEQPKASMHSTSTMPLSGSNLPQAASVGVSTTYDNEAPEPSITTQRRARPDDWVDPQPLTDAVPCLLLLAAAYALRVARKRHQTTNSTN